MSGFHPCCRHRGDKMPDVTWRNKRNLASYVWCNNRNYCLLTLNFDTQLERREIRATTVLLLHGRLNYNWVSIVTQHHYHTLGWPPDVQPGLQCVHSHIPHWLLYWPILGWAVPDPVAAVEEGGGGEGRAGGEDRVTKRCVEVQHMCLLFEFTQLETTIYTTPSELIHWVWLWGGALLQY